MTRGSTPRHGSSSSPTPARRSSSSHTTPGTACSPRTRTWGGRFSALTAFGLVPSGLAGADIDELLDEARRHLGAPRRGHGREPGPRARRSPRDARPHGREDRHRARRHAHRRVRRLGRAAPRGEHGKDGKGLLPVVLTPPTPPRSPRTRRPAGHPHRGAPARRTPRRRGRGRDRRHPRWAVPRVGVRRRGRRPHLTASTRSTSPTSRPPRSRPVRCSTTAPPPPSPRSRRAAPPSARRRVCSVGTTIAEAVTSLLAELDAKGYPGRAGVRGPHRERRTSDRSATRSRRAAGRPVTLGYGPRFLHSTGQYHKGGPANGSSSRSWPTSRTTSASGALVHVRPNSSRPRPPATRACSRRTAGTGPDPHDVGRRRCHAARLRAAVSL